ncbi:MAG: T9SS type A sorting domain-containing protein [Bacteroidetes bacterium]|nr:T9SS type A sorting domain-containing protein [Bacteroidota bacterium]
MQTIRKNERLIYPVPSSGIVNVQGGSAGDVIVISDLTGKLLQKYIADSSTIQMNLSHLTNGYYLVNIFYEKYFPCLNHFYLNLCIGKFWHNNLYITTVKVFA